MYTVLGHSLVGQGRLLEARDAYERALEISMEVDQEGTFREATLGLADIELANNKFQEALDRIEPALRALEGQESASIDDRFRAYLTCYRVLEANHDPRAMPLLRIANALLEQESLSIKNEAFRSSYLNNVRTRRELVRAVKGQSE